MSSLAVLNFQSGLNNTDSIIDIHSINHNGYQFSYADIAKQNLVTIAGKTDPKIPHSTMGDPVKFIARQRAILLEIPERVQKTVAFQILANAEKGQETPTSTVDKTTWRDLDILSGSEKNPEVYLGSLINRTNTELGKTYLLGTIARPTANIALLKNRQHVVKELIGNTELFKELETLFQEMKKTESQLLSFWNTALTLPGTIHNQYWKFNKRIDEKLNNSRVALDIKASWMGMQKALTATIQTVSAVALPLFGLYKMVELTTSNDLQTPELLQNYATHFTGTAGPIYALISFFKNPIASAGASFTAGAVTALSLESTLMWTKADLSMDAIIQNKLVSVATFYKKMLSIHDLLCENPSFAEHLEHFKDLDDVLNSEDENLNKLFDALESNTFSSESSFFFSRGNVLLAFKLLEEKEVQSQLEKALTAVAEVDMYLSIAKLHQEFSSERVKFCFPNYVENSQAPVIKLRKFWNPFVEPNIVVRNSVSLGRGTGSNNAIITGPNSGGKSTVMKSVALTIFLGQSIGIAPAKEMEFTPFAHLSTYMDITDDISNKTSLFQSEVDRSINLHKIIKQLPNGSFSFTMFDELFSGTSPKEGMSIAYAVAEKLGKLHNSISMIATHYSLLTGLDQTKNYTNFKVSVVQEENQPIKRRYKLEKGISDQHIALAVARERGTESTILDRATQILNKI